MNEDKMCFNCKYRDIRETSHEWIDNFCRNKEMNPNGTKVNDPCMYCKYWEEAVPSSGESSE